MEPNWFHFFCLKLSKFKFGYIKLNYQSAVTAQFHGKFYLGFNLVIEEITRPCHNRTLNSF
jgi:hypothetical protein